MSVSSNILDAIELITESSIKKAAYDKTIQAQIISCEDETIGKYKCRYQDAIIYAYSNNIDTTYNEKAYVYILVPDNDMSKEKTILGTVNRLGINYISQAEGEQAYDPVGTNCISSSKTIYLNTAIDKYRYQIYPNENNLITIDSQINNYIKESSSLLIGAVFRTNIQPEKQYRGHYGIQFNLKFKDNATNTDTIRSYILDQDSMIGNPYRMNSDIRQYTIFDIDGQNFEEIDSIEIFCQDFIEAIESSSNNLIDEEDADIFISSLEIIGMNRMTQDEINGVSISFFTPRGTIFDANNGLSEIPITANVRVKGKIASSVQNIPFYWGSENASVFANSQYYNKYLGKGWQCLNDSNVILDETDTNDPVIEWTPKGNIYVVNLNKATAKNNRFKVAILYDNTVITKEINIQNLNTGIPEITIQSSAGTQFYYDIGHPTLTCKVNGKQKPDDYQYSWGYVSNTGVFESYKSYESYYAKEIEEYKNLITGISKIEDEIKKGYANTKADSLKQYKDDLAKFNSIQRVDRNKIYDVQINEITSFRTFKCSVYTSKQNGNVYLGTASITLTNKLEAEGVYSLVINNGSETFQYDQKGIAPTNGSKEVPQQLQVLSFTIYDNLGQPIEEKSNKYKIKWEFPIKNSLLIDKNNGQSSGMDSEENYRYYNNPTLVYDINSKYDIKKQRNQIKLTVNYNNMHLVATTNFAFVKQGQVGTNGTDYVVKLVPNVSAEQTPPLFPMITYSNSSNTYTLNYKINGGSNQLTSGNRKILKAQLWKSGEQIWQGTQGKYSIQWEILKNKYKTNTQDTSAFTIEKTTGNITYKNFLTVSNDEEKTDTTSPSANIIKCSLTVDGKTYYGTIPIITARVASNSYEIELKDYTGFRYVIYSDNGLFPQYDNSSPFEFICRQKFGNIWQDVSLAIGENEKSFSCKVIGNYKSTETNNNTVTSANLLTFDTNKNNQISKNKKYLIPASKYDGICVNESLNCLCKNTNNEFVAQINVPIHFLLNRYGLANINAWDGNSVQINEDGGFILSPQVGAGSKDNNNNFTGILIGETKYPGKKNPEIGLLGFNKGQRTIFLNSSNGSAIFGKTSGGQIIINPTDSKALLYSNNFWKNYNQDGLPTNTNKTNKNNQGMLIDLSDPSIEFGNGYFSVNDLGYLTAKGGGSIAGWSIGTEIINGQTHNILYSNKTKTDGRITLDSYGNGKIYSHNHDTLSSNSSTGFYLSYDGLSIGSKIKISNTGIVTVGSGAVNNKSSYHWTINGSDNNSYISFGGLTKFNENGQSNSVYLGTDGISLGKDFSVSKDGKLQANSGKIGGWTISSSKLSAKDIIIDSNGTISGKYDEKNNKGWQISGSGSAKFNDATIRGTVTANSGSIGGWTIGERSLTSQNSMITLHAGSTDSKVTPYIQVGIKTTSTSYIRINSDGSIQSETPDTGWKINGKGDAVFNKGKFGPWWINANGNAFLGSINENQKSKSIRLYANGDIDGYDISDTKNKSKYWRISDCKAEFSEGIYIGAMQSKNKDTKGWHIKPKTIYSYNSEATIQLGPDGKTISMGYKQTQAKVAAIFIGKSSLMHVDAGGNLYAQKATFAQEATFNNSLKVFTGKNQKTLEAYIESLISAHHFATQTWVSENYATKTALNNYAKTSWFTEGSALTSASLNGTSIKTDDASFLKKSGSWGK